MTIKSYTTLELDLKDKLEQADSLLVKLHQIVCQAPDVTGTELEQTNDTVRDMNQAICDCYGLLTTYLVEDDV